MNTPLNFNLALKKTTAQSSVYQRQKYGYDPHGACNGKTSGGFGFCTCKENQPWWQIDLQGAYKLSEIKIYNRINFEERASTLNVLLSQDAINWQLCYSNPQENLFGGSDGKPLIVKLQHQVARFVRLQLREKEYLHLDEVEIYGIPFKSEPSEFKLTQEEETLSKNFYGQAGLLPFSINNSNTFNSIDYKGQLLQDKWVVMMTKGKQKGLFLEVGSTDGVHLNNTFCLEKNFSWSGICVEPNPDYFKKLCVNRTAITLPYAFYKQSGQIVEFIHHSTLGTISDFLSSDLHASVREKFVSENGTIKVITACPEDILNLYKFPENFDFLSLDIEGAELDVLKCFNLSKFHPALACIEHNHVAHKRLAIFELLSSYGYQRIQCKFDDWYYNLNILEILNPEIPLSYYQEVLKYFCNYHNCELVDEVSFYKNKTLVEEKVQASGLTNNNSSNSVPVQFSSTFAGSAVERNKDNSVNFNPNTNLNLALNKPTAQSSIYHPEKYGYDPYGACNGKKSEKFGFSTCKEHQPWWQIDLQVTYKLSEIKIYNRMDCCQERASTLNVLLSQDALNWQLCYSNPQANLFGGSDSKPLIIKLQNQVARFVRLQLRENEHLHLNEVEIYGSPFQANSSELDFHQDEAILSTNFYSQAYILPSPSPKQIAIKSSKGIIHIGGNQGQEAEFYATHNKSVIWIEALPQVFELLEKKIAKYPNQQAINALVTDTDGKEYKFNVSNNSVSSSLFEFGDAKDKLYPHLTMVDAARLVGKTLSTIYHEFNIDVSKFDFLLLDVQGAELMVLKGAESILHNFKYILTEVSTVNIYKNGVLWDELKAFLNQKGFKETTSETPNKHGDVLFISEKYVQK
ncbi:MAG: FkbM family methyltransferase [Cyanobacteriota bacterium]|nr:FkbM family methyltransferase [Cyanobacteriota bacterium]